MILLLKSYPYHFARSILPVPFCPMPFCPYTILSIPFCPYHFVRYHFVRSPSDALPTTARIGYSIAVSRRSAQGTVSKGLVQGPYVAARAGVEPTTLRLKVLDSTNALPRPTG